MGTRETRVVPHRVHDDPVHWRDRAEEARVVAEKFKDAACRRIMRQVAAGYDQIACAVESMQFKSDSVE